LTIRSINRKIDEFINFVIMKLTIEKAVEKSRADLAKRLGVAEKDIETASAAEQEFSDMSLGAAASGEVSAQMISYGWKIVLRANGRSFEYRGDKYQLRLVNFEGSNHLIIG
jgi:hypothetical protein